MTLKTLLFIVIACGLFFAVLIGGVEWHVRTVHIAQASFTDLHWSKTPGLIVLSPSQRDGKTGLLFIRLRDGKEQFLAGNWKADFTPYGNVFVYGYPPSDMDENKQQLYYIESGEKISHIDIKNSPGAISAVQENPKASYLFIEFTNDTSTSFCIIERYGPQDTDCKQLDVTQVSQGKWNPTKERELVIKTSTHELYTFDPWEKRPIKINSSDSNYQTLTALFEQGKPQLSVKQTMQFAFLNILAIKEGPLLQLFRIPFGAQTAWIIDTDHILFKAHNAIGVIERSTKKFVPLFYDTKDASPMVLFLGIDGTSAL